MENLSEILSNTQIIDNVRDCVNLVERLINNGRPVAFDCEWVPDGTKNLNKITLIQITDYPGRAYIFDLLKCPNLVQYGSIDKLLSSRTIIKVVHDCRFDRSNIKDEFDVDLQNVFDTQIAYQVLQHQRKGIPIKEVKRIGLNELHEFYDLQINPEKENMSEVYRINRHFWASRPLTKDMIVYAASDVMWLLEIYSSFLDDLNSSSKYRVFDLSKGPDESPVASSPMEQLLQSVQNVSSPVRQSSQFSQPTPVRQSSQLAQPIQRVENESSFLNSNLFLGAAGLAAATCFAAWAYNRNTRDGRR